MNSSPNQLDSVQHEGGNTLDDEAVIARKVHRSNNFIDAARLRNKPGACTL